MNFKDFGRPFDNNDADCLQFETAGFENAKCFEFGDRFKRCRV